MTRSMRRPRSAVILVALALAVLGQQPALAAVRQPDATIQRVHPNLGPVVGEDVYNASARRQRATAAHWQPSLGPKKFEFRVLIANDGSIRDRYTVSAPGPRRANGWTIGYYISGGQDVFDVTAEVRAGTFRTPRLDPGETFWLEAWVHADRSEEAGSVTRMVTVASVGNPARVDAVRYRVKERFCSC